MPQLVSLRELYRLDATPAPLHRSVLVLIDFQNTYRHGELRLTGVEDVVAAASVLLFRARAARSPVFHVMHDAGQGSLYDVRAEVGQIIAEVAPKPGEPVIVKRYPSAFFATDLYDQIRRTDRRDLLLAGFMTHIGVSSTARDAYHLGHRPTVVAAATATRPLRGADDVLVDAAEVQAASLAGMADLFALVVESPSDIPE